MSLVHADNFSIYGTDTSLLLDNIYAEVDDLALSTDPDGVASGRVINMVNETSTTRWTALRFALPAGDTTTVGVAGRLWVTMLPESDPYGPHLIVFCNSANALLASLYVTSNGRLRMVVEGGTSYTTTTPVVSANGWYHIEAKYTHGAGALCSFEVRVEGTTVLDETDVAGLDAQIGQIRIDGRNTGAFETPRFYMKDYVIWDGAGSANNDFLGSVLVTNLLPDADVSLNWAPSSGAVGWSILDNVPPVDGTYISAGDPPPSPYVGTLTDLPVDVTSVKGLITIVRAAKSDGGDGSLQVGLISDSAGTPTTGLGADRSITTAFTYWRDVFELDPDTSAAWLPAAVNAVQLQLDRTT